MYCGWVPLPLHLPDVIHVMNNTSFSLASCIRLLHVLAHKPKNRRRGRPGNMLAQCCSALDHLRALSLTVLPPPCRLVPPDPPPICSPEQVRVRSGEAGCTPPWAAGPSWWRPWLLLLHKLPLRGFRGEVVRDHAGSEHITCTPHHLPLWEKRLEYSTPHLLNLYCKHVSFIYGHSCSFPSHYLVTLHSIPEVVAQASLCSGCGKRLPCETIPEGLRPTAIATGGLQEITVAWTPSTSTGSRLR